MQRGVVMAESIAKESNNHQLIHLLRQGGVVETYPGNLPLQLTALLGREQEVEAACALLQRPDVRLLTLTGTGGIGKTRLGLAIATGLQAAFADGAYFVSLAPLNDPDLIVPTIAEVFDLREVEGQLLLDLLKAYLQNKHLLLLLDH